MDTKKNRIKHFRTQANLTQRELARLVGSDVMQVNRHETGNRGISEEMILRYAKVFKIPSYRLFLEAAGPKESWQDGDESPVETELRSVEMEAV